MHQQPPCFKASCSKSGYLSGLSSRTVYSIDLAFLPRTRNRPKYTHSPSIYTYSSFTLTHEHHMRTLIECHSPGTTYVRKRGSLTRRVRYDWTACFPCNLPPQPPKSGERFAVTIMLPGRVRRRRDGIYRGYSRQSPSRNKIS